MGKYTYIICFLVCVVNQNNHQKHPVMSVDLSATTSDISSALEEVL